MEYFLTEAADKLRRNPVQLSQGVFHALQRYSFPGNIRELQNIIYRLSCLAGDKAELQDLPDTVRGSVSGVPGLSGARHETLEQARNEAITHAESSFLIEKLKEFGGNVSRMSESMGMNRSYIQKLLKKYEIHSKEYKNKKK